MLFYSRESAEITPNIISNTLSRFIVHELAVSFENYKSARGSMKESSFRNYK